MDPLSLTASIITIAALANSTSQAFIDLRTVCKDLPGRLHALSNEVADFELVIQQVALLVEKRAQGSYVEDQHSNILHLLKQANVKLDELRSIIEKLTKFSVKNKISLFKLHAWRRDQPKLLALQEDIKTIKCSLNILLGASNSQVFSQSVNPTHYIPYSKFTSKLTTSLEQCL